MERYYFGQFLESELKEKGISLKKLSEISGISLKNLEALREDEYGALPPSPYVYGYIKKLGFIFGFNSDEWLQRIRASNREGHPPAEDKFPAKPVRKHILPRGSFVTLLIIAGLVLIFGIESPKIFGRPVVVLQYPEQNPAVATSKDITLTGTVKNGSELFINGESVDIGSSGAWGKTIALEAGMNPVEIKAEKFLGGETKIVEQIIYNATATSLSTSTNPGGI